MCFNQIRTAADAETAVVKAEFSTHASPGERVAPQGPRGHTGGQEAGGARVGPGPEPPVRLSQGGLAEPPAVQRT